MAVDWKLALVDGWTGPAAGILKSVAKIKKSIADLNGSGAVKDADIGSKAIARAQGRIAAIQASSAGRIAAIEAADAGRRLQIAAKLEADRARIAAAGASKLEQIAWKAAAKEDARPKHQAARKNSGFDDAALSLVTGGGLQGALSALGPAGQAVGALVGVAERIVEATAGLAVAGARLAIDSTEFKANSVASFKALTGSATEASDLYTKAIDLSERLGISKEDAIGKIKKQLAAGLKPADALGVITTIENATAGIGERAGAAVEKSLTKISAKGFMDNRALTALAGAGIKTQDIYEALSKRMNKSVKDVELLTRKGKVNSVDAIAAIEEVVNKKTGGLAEMKGSSITGRVLAIKTELGGLFDSIDTKPFQGALDNVVKVLHGSAGAGLKSAITDLGGDLFHTLFDQFSGPDGAKKLEAFVQSITIEVRKLDAALKEARPSIELTLSLLSTLAGSEAKTGGNGPFTAAYRGAKLLLNVVSGNLPAAINDVLKMLGSDFKIPEIGITDLINEFDKIPSGLFSPLTNQISDAVSAVEGFAGDMYDAGSQLVEGLVQGIKDDASAVAEAVISACSDAISAAKSILGIHSPSSVFADIGSFTAQGFAEGVEGEPGPKQAMQAMVAPPQTSGATGGGGRGGTSIHLELGDMHVTSQASDPKEVASEARAQVADVLEEFARELGLV